MFYYKMARFYLPDDVLKIIKDYTRPLTRPDWRTLHLMPLQKYSDDYYTQYMKRRFVLYSCSYEEYYRLESNYKRIFNRNNFYNIFGKIDCNPNG